MPAIKVTFLMATLIVAFTWQVPFASAQMATSAQNLNTAQLSPEAQEYLNKALDIIQNNSVKREIDWHEFRRLTLEKAAQAKKPADTYPAIRDALRRLGDNHSTLFSLNDIKAVNSGKVSGPNKDIGILIKNLSIVAIFPHSSASQAALEIRDKILAVNGTSINSDSDYYKNIDNAKKQNVKDVELTLKRGDAEPKNIKLEFAEYDINPPLQGRLLAENIGLIVLPSFSVGSDDAKKMANDLTSYAEQVQKLIHDLDQQNVQGWIIDLRLNYGGNMWPMLCGIGPILGEGMVGGFVSAKDFEKWSYQDGKAMNEKLVNTEVPMPYKVKKENQPVAILTDFTTASSAEAIVIAFKNRAKTHFFGISTRGIPTANFPFQLSDGAILNLTTGLDADRTGKSYDSKIPPDTEIPINWALYGNDDDPLIKAAVKWLKSQN